MAFNRRQLLIANLLFLTISAPIIAHHGHAAYDDTKEVTLRGAVIKLEWSNPHTLIYFDVRNTDGNVVHWGCETVPPKLLARHGWTKDDLKIGDKVTVTLVAAKNGAPVGLLRKLVVDDTGQVLQVPAEPQ